MCRRLNLEMYFGNDVQCVICNLHAVFSFSPVRKMGFKGSEDRSWTHTVALARLCTVLAIRVKFLAPVSCGNSCVRLNRLGDRMAGHRKRRKMQELINFSLMSSRPFFWQRSRRLENTLFSSLRKNKPEEFRDYLNCKTLNYFLLPQQSCFSEVFLSAKFRFIQGLLNFGNIFGSIPREKAVRVDDLEPGHLAVHGQVALVSL